MLIIFNVLTFGETKTTMAKLQLTGIPEELKNDLVKIAKEKEGLTLSSFLKPHLRKLRDSYSSPTQLARSPLR